MPSHKHSISSSYRSSPDLPNKSAGTNYARRQTSFLCGPITDLEGQVYESRHRVKEIERKLPERNRQVQDLEKKSTGLIDWMEKQDLGNGRAHSLDTPVLYFVLTLPGALASIQKQLRSFSATIPYASSQGSQSLAATALHTTEVPSGLYL
jgi:hypothetical protein